jgi:dephospho-CoA kinase
MIRARVAFIGLQGSGKTTATEAFGNYLGDYIHFKFAQPIYDVLDAVKKPKHRLFMQQFSDLAKEHFGINIFNEIAEKKLEEYPKDAAVICDDCRFPFEVELLKKYNFTLVYVDSPEDLRKERLGDLFRNPNHNSEASVESLKKHCDIILDGSTHIDIFRNEVIGALVEHLNLY